MKESLLSSIRDQFDVCVCVCVCVCVRVHASVCACGFHSLASQGEGQCYYPSESTLALT